MPISSSSSLLQLALETLPEALILTDSSGKVLLGNKALGDLLGVEAERLVGRNVTTFFALADEKIGLPVLDENWQGPVLWAAADGKSLTLYIVIRALNEGDGRCCGYTIVFRNIYEARKREDYRRVLHQEKLEALGMYAGSIAHDLNNVLTSVLGHVSFSRVGMKGGDSPLRESITAIEEGTRRAAGMTQQILEYARGAESEYASVNFSSLIRETAKLLRGSFAAGVSLTMQLPEADAYVYGDESQLSQLLANLTVNARDAVSGNGKIEISLVEEVVSQEKRARELNIPCGSYLRLSVCDNGMGIPAAVRERIFEPFFTTKSSQGTGLGLATVHAIVRAHHGAIRFESEEGQGTYFEVFLPRFNAPSTVSKSEAKSLPVGAERILVVDDEESVRLIIQRSLEHLGYCVDTAQNGPEALELFRRGKYQLVIVDMIMPQMSGDELFFKLQGLDDNVAVLIASGYSSDKRTKAVLQAGGRGFIQKPFAVEELAQEVRKCLDS